MPWAYSLASHGRIVAEFELPAYGDWLTAKKFFLFPVAAAADVLGVGAAAGVIRAMEASSQASALQFAEFGPKRRCPLFESKWRRSIWREMSML